MSALCLYAAGMFGAVALDAHAHDRSAAAIGTAALSLVLLVAGLQP